MLKRTLPFLFLFISFFCFSQNPKLSSDAEISILTCGRGEELYSTFGHTALRIKDEKNLLDVVYNYGMFDFNTKNFYLSFVKGDLQYFMNVTSFDEFIFEYKNDKREVIEQVLNLNSTQKQSLFEKLNNSLYSTEKYYTYKFIDRNCTTMVQDKINETLDEITIEKVDDKTITYREVLYPYFDNYFWYKTGINFMFGAKTDKKAEKLFLPIELLNSLDKVKIKGKSLVLKKITLNTGIVQEATSFSFLNSIYLIIIFLLILVIINNNFLLNSYLFICGVLGLFLIWVGFYSQHQELLMNYNILLFNPLFILLLFVKSKKRLLLLCIGMLLLYTILMLLKPHLLIMLPFIISIGFILAKKYLKRNTDLLTSVK